MLLKYVVLDYDGDNNNNKNDGDEKFFCVVKDELRTLSFLENYLTFKSRELFSKNAPS